MYNVNPHFDYELIKSCRFSKSNPTYSISKREGHTPNTLRSGQRKTSSFSNSVTTAKAGVYSSTHPQLVGAPRRLKKSCSLLNLSPSFPSGLSFEDVLKELRVDYVW